MVAHDGRMDDAPENAEGRLATTVTPGSENDTTPDTATVELDAILPQQAPPVAMGFLGTGGMATVYEAFDEPLNREVALKRLRDDAVDDERSRREFVREARITGQLQHPNIVPIHMLGADENGRPFFTMQIVEGQTFGDWLAQPERAPGARERLEKGLEILIKVCDAVSYAHSRGVLHRDIKPDNVMVGPYGRVYLMDWGVALGAKDREGTHSHGVAGTPGYMAPEQARGESIDERADIFGLGAILYQIVSGRLPYDGKNRPVLFEAASGAVVPITRVVGPEISPRICAVADRALSPLKEDRYSSVEQFQNDLRNSLLGGFHLPKLTFQAGETILNEGATGDAAYMIIDGSCRVFQTVDGKECEIRTMGEGDIFGELALLLDGPRTATVIAASTTTLLIIDRATLKTSGVLHGWSAALLKALARRFRESEKPDKI